MRARSILGLAALSLTACAGRHVEPAQPTQPVIEARVEQVEVPVAVACIDPGKVPARPQKAGSAFNGDAVHDADVLAQSNLRLLSALDQALALIAGCTADLDHH